MFPPVEARRVFFGLSRYLRRCGQITRLVAKYFKIGLFDSGVGGLTVARALKQTLPAAELLYLADNANAPYGSRSEAEVLRFSHDLSQRLIGAGCDLIVVACNTATSVAIASLRSAYPDCLFVGMEPAIKPAAAKSRNGRIGVMATALTLAGDRYQQLVQRFATGTRLLTDPCVGLVPLIESEEPNGERIRLRLMEILRPMLDRDIDTLVLGCTHYPLVRAAIEEICGPGVKIIDPAPAAARQAARLLRKKGPRSTTDRPDHFFATGDPLPLERTLNRMGWRWRVRG